MKNVYKRTSVDALKDNADMLLEACDGGSYTINAKGIELAGRGVKCRYSNGCYEVTEALYRKLSTIHNIVTNF